MMELNDKTVLVTGATGGIGRAIVERLLQDGATVVGSGTRQEKLEQLKQELDNERFHIHAADLSDGDAINELVKFAEGVADGVDILVCNAGVTKDNLTMRMSEEDFATVLDINLKAPFLLAKALMRPMMKRKFGRVITIGSVVGTAGNPGQANYVASKAGLAGLVKSLALETASRGLTYNNVAPGFIRTAMTDALNDEQKNGMLAKIPVGYFGEPADVAGVVRFLASEDARYVTGQTIHVNGGMVMV